MTVPDYHAPDTLDAALTLKLAHGEKARVIAGGTDLIMRMRDKVFSPELLLDLRNVSLDRISMNTDDITIGAFVTQTQILENDTIVKTFPALAEACRHFAGPSIRNRGTIGGNIVNASPAADLVPPLIAYDANIVLSSSASVRVLPLLDFITGPGENVMQADEILTKIQLPLPPGNTAALFFKLGQRRSMAISIVNLATRLTFAETAAVSDIRIVFGAVAPMPVRAFKAESLLAGKPLTDELIKSAARQAGQETSPISDVRASKDYRLKMTGVLLQRALMKIKAEPGQRVTHE